MCTRSTSCRHPSSHEGENRSRRTPRRPRRLAIVSCAPTPPSRGLTTIRTRCSGRVRSDFPMPKPRKEPRFRAYFWAIARQILDGVIERLMAAAHEAGGTVNQVMGDGIMAMFGAPVVRPDHAARACRAALSMQETVAAYARGLRGSHRADVQIRVGINSGEVIVRSVASDLRSDYTAVGMPTHVAARMEQLATPGSIVITADNLAQIEDRVDVS